METANSSSVLAGWRHSSRGHFGLFFEGGGARRSTGFRGPTLRAWDHNRGHPDEGEEPSYEKTFPENRARGSADTDAIEIEQERRVAGT
jgi:hypothetical protein